jgi:predicted aspartyl protease
MRTALGVSILVALVTAALLAPATQQASSQSTGSDVTVEILLTRWAEALGGVKRLRAVHATYSRARVEGSEGEGRAEEWSTARGERRQTSETTTTGEWTSVFDGRRGWVRENGRVRTLSPDETSGQLTAAYLAASSHLVTGRLSGRCEYLGQSSTDRCHTLEITARGGRPARYYLHPGTFLPVRSEREMVSTTLTIQYRDWRMVDGIRVPGRQVLATTDSGFMATETLEEIRFNPALESGLFARPTEGPSGVRFDRDSHVGRIPIMIRAAHIFFRGQLNDSTVWLSLDTGAPSNVIDEEYARSMGVPLLGRQRIFGAAGSTESARVRGVSVRLPGVRMEAQSFATTPFDAIAAAIGLPVKAILGYDVFSRFIVEIDYAGREMRLHDPAHYRYRGKGATVPITLRENEPYVHAQIRMPNGSLVDGEFVIDAGSGSTLMLATEFAAAHGLPQSLERKLQTRAGAVGGEMRTVAARLPGLRVGPYQVDDPVVLFPTGEITAPGTAGNIGGALLSRFVVTFDYGRMRMTLEPNATFAEREEYDMSGLALSTAGADGSMIRVVRVRPQSPGDSAGVKPGDVLERIDDLRASELGLDSLRTLFRRERSYDLIVRRDDRTLPVILRTRRQL